jgi:hypothetical protein
MAKINQIQNALKELGGGAFQNLADSYLLKKGYPQIIDFIPHSQASAWERDINYLFSIHKPSPKYTV